ncbi:MAG: hypothetical protein ACFE95_14430 [Candidatus Hodarchaeota archaeon]
MFQNYHVPKRLKTKIFPGRQIRIWINEKNIDHLNEVAPKEQPFVRDFINNLEELGWIVIIQSDQSTKTKRN